MAPTDISEPTKATLAKYGGTPELWRELLDAQGGTCGVCERIPNPSKRDGKRRFVIDHEHIRGWKKLPPAERWQYVRGLVCWWCNTTYLGRGITVAIAKGVVRYLERYAERRPA